MGERCEFCGLPLLHGPGLRCCSASTCSERRAFEAGQEAGHLACLDYEARARAIRAVVAAQWGVAVALMGHRAAESLAIENMRRVLPKSEVGDGYIAGLYTAVQSVFQFVSPLPTAEQIVDGAV